MAVGLAAGLVAGPGGKAVADQTVVSATVFPGSGGSITHPSVSLNQLQSCPPWKGSDTIGLYAPNAHYYAPAGLALNSTWSLEKVITCALQQPLSVVTQVMVQRTDGSWGPALTSGDLSDETRYHDPLSADELPVVSVNGTGGGVQYVRPWKGGSDNNAADWIPQNGPVTSIQIYENGSAPLPVTASDNVSGSSVSFSASVAGVPASDLTWEWSFGDLHGSGQQNPQYTYTSSGRFVVTVNVTDASTNQGGNATLIVNIGSQDGTGTTPQSGAGPTTPASGAPSGPTATKGSSPGASPGPSGQKSPTGNNHHGHAGATQKRAGDQHTPTHKSSTTTTTPASGTGSPGSGTRGGSGSAPTGGSTGGNQTAAGSSAPTGGQPNSATHRASLVSGRLLSNVTPVAPERSPLVHVLPAAAGSAPQVRRAIAASMLPVFLSALVVALLFLLGAGRELVWRTGWRGTALGRLRGAVSWS